MVRAGKRMVMLAVAVWQAARKQVLPVPHFFIVGPGIQYLDPLVPAMESFDCWRPNRSPATSVTSPRCTARY